MNTSFFLKHASPLFLLIFLKFMASYHKHVLKLQFVKFIPMRKIRTKKINSFHVKFTYKYNLERTIAYCLSLLVLSFLHLSQWYIRVCPVWTRVPRKFPPRPASPWQRRNTRFAHSVTNIVAPARATTAALLLRVLYNCTNAGFILLGYIANLCNACKLCTPIL